MAADLVLDTLDTDILVLGAGGAGLCAALHAADRAPRLTVTVAVKGLLGRAGCTRMVQGGYNAVLAAPDSLDAHLLDTLQGGAWINDQELVWTLVHEAPARVLELEARYGCFFDRHPDGRIHQKPFAGQSHDRTIHKGDLTGIEIMNRLTEQVWRRPSIRPLEEHRAVELLRADGGHVGGVLLLDVRRGTFVVVRSRAILLAMGGGPTMYKVIACSADKSSDGIALGLHAGVPLRDMEMVQFHPTGLIVPNSLMTGALLEEGLRGAGGRLLNGRGERFMQRYDATRLERSTRDLVARACHPRCWKAAAPPTAACGSTSRTSVRRWSKNLPRHGRRRRDFASRPRARAGRGEPTAHFMMGGIVIDRACRTDVEGLFAAGEDTGGVHGANRLGGNGVAESTVFGGIAGDVMADWVVGRPLPQLSRANVDAAVAATTAPLERSESGESLYALQARLRQLMWDHAGLIRAGEGLKLALTEIEDISSRLESVAVRGGGAYNVAWQDWINLQNQATVSWLIARSALERTESRGSHYRRDFPATTGEPVTVLAGFADGAGPKVWTEPVRFTRLKPDAGRRPTTVDVGD
jgi:fumarate reductase flavoprotein subunit